MYRKQFLQAALILAATCVLAGPTPAAWAGRAITKGTIVVQVYREPRPGRRIKLANQLVRLNTGHTAVTNRYGVATFSNMAHGGYYARAGAWQSPSAGLNSRVLRLEIAIR